MKIFQQEEFPGKEGVEITEVMENRENLTPKLLPGQEFAIEEQDEDAASDTAPAYNCQIDLFE